MKMMMMMMMMKNINLTFLIETSRDVHFLLFDRLFARD